MTERPIIVAPLMYGGRGAQFADDDHLVVELKDDVVTITKDSFGTEHAVSLSRSELETLLAAIDAAERAQE